MGRAERQLDPEAGEIPRFAWDLRQLRIKAGKPSYRVLASRVHYSASMLSEAAAGQTLPSLAVTLAYVRGCGGDVREWESRWHRLAAAPAPAPDPQAAPPPYLGLSTFQAGDAALFFGRDALVAELTGRLETDPFLAVFGASGSGKSSLLRAGLMPALGPACQLLTPGVEPLQELAAALATLQGTPAAALHADLRADPGSAALAVRQVLAARGGGAGRLVLVVDQFEEVFTLCRDETTRRLFLECLLAVVAGAADRARVVIGVRADFYPHCAAHPGLVAALRDRQVLVGPMTDAELRSVVTGPAATAGCVAEAALVDAVLADVAGQPGALPLVSHALLETWQRREGTLLTLAAYREAGGVAEAVARTAERVFDELDPDQRGVARDVFLRLTALGEGTEDTRRHAAYEEIASASAVVDRLTAARLVTRDERTVTVAHEVLIRRWPRLRGWLAADRDQLRAHRRLTEATAEWQQHDRDDAFLWRGSRLAAWHDRPAGGLNDAELAFLTAGRRVEARERQARIRRTRGAAALIGLATVIVTVLATVGTVQARRAAGERDLAVSHELAAASREQLALKPELALLLARRAVDIRPTPAAEAALRQATAQIRVRAVLPAGTDQVFGVAHSPDGAWTATSGDDGTLRIWARDGRGIAAGRPRVLTGHESEVWSPVFSPDSTRVAAGGIDGVVTVWELGSGSKRAFSAAGPEVWGVAFSPDGRRLAAAADDGTVRIWDALRGGAPLTVLRGPSRQLGVAFSPDGRHLAAGDGDGVIRLWAVAGTGFGAPRLLRGPATSVESLAFSPDSAAIAGASTDGTVRVWRLLGSGDDAVTLRGDGSGTAETVAFSPDGRRVATGGSDGTLRIFQAGGDADPLVLPGHDGPIWSVAFSPDGAWVASGSGDGTVRFWDPGSSALLRGHEGAVWAVTSGVAGGRLVSGGADGSVRVWGGSRAAASAGPVASGAVSAGPVSSGLSGRVLAGHEGDVVGLAASPDGLRVASAGMDGTARVWEVDTGEATVLKGHDGAVWQAAFLPDGRSLVTGGTDGTVRVWDLSAGTDTVLGRHDGAVRTVAASPDGRHVASGGRDGTVRLWDRTTGAAATVLHGHQGGLIFQVAFSPDGRTVASGGHDGTLRLWTVGTSGHEHRILRGHRGAVWSVAWRPDGRMLITSGDDGGVRLWDVATGSAVTLRGFGSPAEGTAFGPGPGELATVHDDGTTRITPCDVCGSLDELRRTAERLTIRDFTTEERHTYLD